jgi:hypothetical protein
MRSIVRVGKSDASTITGGIGVASDSPTLAALPPVPPHEGAGGFQPHPAHSFAASALAVSIAASRMCP